MIEVSASKRRLPSGVHAQVAVEILCHLQAERQAGRLPGASSYIAPRFQPKASLSPFNSAKPSAGVPVNTACDSACPGELVAEAEPRLSCGDDAADQRRIQVDGLQFGGLRVIAPDQEAP